MPTSSFDKQFIVTDPEAIRRFKESLDNPQVVKVRPPVYASAEETADMVEAYLRWKEEFGAIK